MENVHIQHKEEAKPQLHKYSNISVILHLFCFVYSNKEICRQAVSVYECVCVCVLHLCVQAHTSEFQFMHGHFLSVD